MPKQQNFFSNPVRVIKLLCLLAVVGGFSSLIWYATIHEDYIRSEDLDPMLVKAPASPVKRRAEEPGGMHIPHQDKKVFDLLQETADAKEISAQHKSVEPKSSNEGDVDSPEDVIAKQIAHLESQAQKNTPAKVEPEKNINVAKVEQDSKKEEVSNLLDVPTGLWGVQLASFLTKADAKRAIETYKSRFSSELSGLNGYVKKADLGSKGIRYRAWFLGKSNRNEANNICSTLKSRKQGCLPVKS